jgi:xanthosine utilization system XapX-like protein
MPSFAKGSEFRQSVTNQLSKAAPNDDLELGRLKDVSQNIRLMGELVAFLGIMVAFFALIHWPDNPQSLQGLKGTIYFPASLAAELNLSATRIGSLVLLSDLVPISMKNAAIPVLALLGLSAILRRRWVLAGLFFAVLLFPWPLIGYHFPVRSVFLATFALILAIRILPIHFYLRLALIPLAIFFYKPVLSTTASSFASILGLKDTPTQDYRFLRFSELQPNQPTETKSSNPSTTEPMTTFLGSLDNPNDKAGYAYAQAQEHAFRGQMDAAVKLLDEAEHHNLAQSPFTERRFEIIRNHAIASGLNGPTEQESIISSHQTQTLVSSFIVGTGILLGLMGPFAGIISSRIQRRTVRITEAYTQLKQQSRSIIPSAATKANSAATATSSNHASDLESGNDIVTKASKRANLYSLSACILAGLSCLAAYSSVLFWLPSAGSNAAFDKVSLVGNVKTIVEQSGNQVSSNGVDPGFMWSGAIPLYMPIMGILLLSLIVFRSHAKPILAGMLLIFVAAQIYPLVPNRNSMFEIAASNISTEVRSQLQGNKQPTSNGALKQQIPTLPSFINMGTGKAAQIEISDRQKGPSLPSFSAIGSQKADSLTNPKGPKNKASFLQDKTVPVLKREDFLTFEKLNAIYALAQIAYLENKPEQASEQLTFLIQNGMPQSLVHLRKIALMIDWVEARGHPLPDHKSKPRIQALTDVPRFISQIFYWLSVAIGLSACVTLILGFVANRKLRNIDALVQQKLDYKSGHV